MNMLKGVMARLKRQKKRKKRLAIAVSVMACLLAVIALAFTNMSTLKSLISWKRLVDISDLDNCRDSCLLLKEKYRKQIIINYGIMKPLMLEALMGEEYSSAVKREAISLLVSQESDICGKEVIPSERSIGRISLSSFLAIYETCDVAITPSDLSMVNYFLKDSSGDDRAGLLRILAGKVPKIGLESAFYEVINGSEVSEGVSILAWLHNQGQTLSQKQIESIYSNSLKGDNSEILLRIVFLAGDYYQDYPDISESFLKDVASGTYDDYSHLAAESILAGKGIALPDERKEGIYE